MRTQTFTTAPIISLLRQQTVASLPQIMQALGTPSHRTACRRLAEANCRSSYSHRGRFYTLDELASYDSNGLWFHGDVRFSLHGGLMATLEALASMSTGGYFAAELSELLAVGTQDALRILVRDNRLSRRQVSGRYLYCSADSSRHDRQVSARRMVESSASFDLADPDPTDTMVLQATAAYFGSLDERQRRLFAGLESIRHGHGGDRRVAGTLGISSATVATGRRQLLGGDIDPHRVRKPGGGRKSIEKKTTASSN